MKKIKKILLLLLIFSFILAYNFVNADSGLDSDYKETQSLAGGIINVIFSLGEFIFVQPGSEDYAVAHALICILCIITFLIVTAVHLFKLRKKKQTVIEIITRLGISLNMTIIFTLLCFLTEFQLILYILIMTIYIIILVNIVKVILKKRLEKGLAQVKEIDKEFNEEKINNDIFNVYKDIQLAWCSLELDKIKELISDEMYNKYTKKIDELNSNSQKNIMSDIEYDSNKIVDISIEDNIEIITCEMNVKCYDYIINEKEKVVKGEKDKKYKYTYKLVFNRNIKDNKYILIEKKILKTKLDDKIIKT